MGEILIVDDDPGVIESIRDTLKDDGYIIHQSSDGKDIMKILDSAAVDVVLLDVSLGELNGVEILKIIKESRPSINVIMISGTSVIETAISAIRIGAYDFIEKPLGRNKLKITVKNAMADRKSREENDRYRCRMLDSCSFGGEGTLIKEVEKLIDKAASSLISVLITGENGTGKEIAAKRLHYKSGRASMPFTAVNCAAIPGELLESELFGHKKGSFTGASSDRDGLFIKARGGTVFLDEIGDMPLELQAKMLRVLQEKEVVRIGDSSPVKIDVRIISASNRNISGLISSGNFREDLYYRLNGLEINLPSLKERKEDIPELVKKFITEICHDSNMTMPGINPGAVTALQKYAFPGNVRELRNIVHRSLILCDGGIIDKFQMPEIDEASLEIDQQPGTLQEVKQMLLAKYLQKRLEALNGDRKKLAQELGIHANNLYRLI